MFAAVCTSFGANLAGATAVAALFVALSSTTRPDGGFELMGREDLLTNVVAMYAVVGAVSLVSRFEQIRSNFDRVRRRRAMDRERELLRERVELSQAIHDTIAQSAFTIGLRLEAAIEVASAQKDENREELVAKLEAMLALSKSTMWELRHPALAANRQYLRARLRTPHAGQRRQHPAQKAQNHQPGPKRAGHHPQKPKNHPPQATRAHTRPEQGIQTRTRRRGTPTARRTRPLQELHQSGHQRPDTLLGLRQDTRCSPEAAAQPSTDRKGSHPRKPNCPRDRGQSETRKLPIADQATKAKSIRQEHHVRKTSRI